LHLLKANLDVTDCYGRGDRRALRPFERRRLRRNTDARTVASHGTGSKQIVQRQRLAPLVLLKGFTRHTAD
jgi:hypothetical protein